MTDEKDIGRRSLKDRRHQRLSSLSSQAKISSIKPMSDHPYDSSSFQRHPIDFVSVLSLSQRRPSERGSTLSRSFASDPHPIASYSFRSPSSSITPFIALPTSSDGPTDQRQIILPTLTPRVGTASDDQRTKIQTSARCLSREVKARENFPV